MSPHPVVLVAVRVGVARRRRASRPPCARRRPGRRAAGRRAARTRRATRSPRTRRSPRSVGGSPVRSKVTRRMSVSCVGFGGGGDASPGERREHEAVDLVLRGRARLTDGTAGFAGRDERPVRLPLGALLDPAHERRRSAIGQREARLGRRHLDRRVVAEDAATSSLRRVLPGTTAVCPEGSCARGAVLRVEPQAGLARAIVGAVALEAAVREDRPHVEVEVDDVGHAGHRGRAREHARRAVPAAVAARPSRTTAVRRRTRRAARPPGSFIGAGLGRGL